MNIVVLSGRLCGDPETRSAGSATVHRFRLAVNRSRKNKDGKYDTDFVTCEAWDKTGEIVSKYRKKGDFLQVQGRLEIRQYTAQDGSKREAATVQVTNIDLAGGTSSGKANTDSTGPDTFTPADDDELPF